MKIEIDMKPDDSLPAQLDAVLNTYIRRQALADDMDGDAVRPKRIVVEFEDVERKDWHLKTFSAFADFISLETLPLFESPEDVRAFCQIDVLQEFLPADHKPFDGGFQTELSLISLSEAIIETRYHCLF